MPRQIPVYLTVLMFGVCFENVLIRAADATLHVSTPLSPPTWALLQREVLDANAQAVREFYDRYFDERGFHLCVERWGGDDGPDDAIETCLHWPVLHALGGDDELLKLSNRVWEGHLRQFTLAKTVEVPLARDGMYYREFPVCFDWLHHSEGLTVFCMLGLSQPDDEQLLKRMTRFAGFYASGDTDPPNYDPQHRVIRSLFNGSRGPLLRRATALDWAGDPIEVAGRFKLGHGERSYQEMLDHFRDYNDVVGDHPQNLQSTALALHAYLLTHDDKYRQWLLDYVDAWRQRTIDNGGIIPTNIGLDGRIGGAAGGKWYGGVYGWAFSVVVPQTGELAHRNSHALGLDGFKNAYLLTGDDRFLDPWRQQIDRINAQGKTINGRIVYPRMFGDDGWYHFTPEKYDEGAFDIYYLTQQDSDRRRVGERAWLQFLDGKDSNYPDRVLRRDLDRIRQRVAEMREDNSTPDTRLSDDAMRLNPATVDALVQLAWGALPLSNRGLVLHSRLRYFDPVRRRAGLPPDTAALIERMSADETVVTLVNLNQLEPRTVLIQAGGYAEHEFTRASLAQQPPLELKSPALQVRLAPGCGSRVTLNMNRYSRVPTLSAPW